MKKDDLLLVIDMQNVYKKGGKWECLNTEKAASNVNRIIDFPRFNGNALFTRFIADEKALNVWADYNVKYSDVNNNSFANEMIPELKDALKKFPLYTKSVYSSLAVPEVAAECKKAKRVVVAGVVAECCVLSTVLNLIDEGIYVIYLTDGVSGLDRPKETATELILSGLQPLHVKMMTTQEYLEEK